VRIFKTTVQGEMVQRSLATPEIFSSQIEGILQQAARPKEPRLSAALRGALEWFSGRVRERYEQRVRSEGFLELVKQTTPYPYLDLLNIGSRPVKRSGKLSLDNLRAIPWILCWTQTRVLFPTWWGVGSTWKESDRARRTLLKRLYRKSALFRSFVKLLGFTLAKVELPVWRMYLDASGLGKEHVEAAFVDFEREFRLTGGFVREVSGQKNFLWFRPWLGTSIQLRAPMIHPLNLLQILSLEVRDTKLLRETVTGIACGMLTTG
jgi:phosphoenolpyruvate carboxylase